MQAQSKYDQCALARQEFAKEMEEKMDEIEQFIAEGKKLLAKKQPAEGIKI